MKRRNLLSMVIGSNIVSVFPNIVNAQEEQSKMNEESGIRFFHKVKMFPFVGYLSIIVMA